MRFYLVRHGNTFDAGDTVTRVGARTDLPLSASGMAQAEALAAHFEGQDIPLVLHSPLQRTTQTAEAVASHLYSAIGQIMLGKVDGLREIDYGPDENQPEEAVVARLGADALAAWDREAVMPADWAPRPEEITAFWEGLFQSFFGEGAPPFDTVMIVTSNGVARFALDALALETRPSDIKLRTGSYGVIETDDGRTGRVLAWNIRP